MKLTHVSLQQNRSSTPSPGSPHLKQERSGTLSTWAMTVESEEDDDCEFDIESEDEEDVDDDEEEEEEEEEATLPVAYIQLVHPAQLGRQSVEGSSSPV
jgi:hypothetical protein